MQLLARTLHRLYGSQSSDSDPFPWQQLTILSLCRVCEPIAFMSIFPYIYYMVESFGITGDNKKVALYAGMVTSAFALAEAISGSVWGRLSDKFGRKPILICGLAGTGISMLAFGFAPNLPTAIVARALGGLLNGNIGVLQTTVSEVATVDAHRPFAFAIFPTVWCIGAVLGSVLGGSLADPVRAYPTLFSQGSIFDRFPYLLPNLVCAAIVLVGMLVGLLFLKETHEDLHIRRDPGLELGKWICRLRTWRSCTRRSHLQQSSALYSREELTLLQDDDLPPDYRSTASSPTLHATNGGSPPPYQPIGDVADLDDLGSIEMADSKTGAIQRDSGVRKHLTKQVVYNIAAFGILAYHTISAEQLLPVLFSLPESDTPPQLPFHFTGGFGLPTKSIGTILSVQAAMQMVATIVVFPFVHRKLGLLTTYRIVVLSYPLLYILVPYITLVPTLFRMPAVYAILVWKVTAQALAFPANNMMLANQSPKRILGTFNGLSCSAASAARAVGPTVSGLLQATGLANHLLALPWWCNALVAILGSCLSLIMLEPKWDPNSEKVADEAAIASAVRGSGSALRAIASEAEATVAVLPDGPHVSADGLFSRPASPLLTRPSCDVWRHGRSGSKNSFSA